MAFNRILDFSNGLDFYLGFFLSLPLQTVQIPVISDIFDDISNLL